MYICIPEPCQGNIFGKNFKSSATTMYFRNHTSPIRSSHVRVAAALFMQHIRTIFFLAGVDNLNLSQHLDIGSIARRRVCATTLFALPTPGHSPFATYLRGAFRQT